MNDIENAVAEHYGTAGLLARILAGLEAVGADLDNLRPEDLAPVDEFHIGGRKATAHAVAGLSLGGDERVLDIGCGIGGTARFIAEQSGCAVTGIDLTPEYIAVADQLTELTGQGGKMRFEVASALDLPFEDESFDAAISIHVAMNIHDRAGLYRETARVLQPGAALCIYDVMVKNGEELAYPVPWAQSAETSHLTTPEETRTLLADAEFEIGEVEDRAEFALDFFRQRVAAAAKAKGPPPLGIHLLMGADAPQKFKNMLANVEGGRVAPVQITARRR